MLRFATDVNFDRRILRGLRRRLPDIDVVRVQDVGLEEAEDPDVLEWVASEGRILLTHDLATMPRFAYDRLGRGKSIPGLIEISMDLAIGVVIEDLFLLASAGTPEDFEGRVIYLPL